MSLHAAVVVVAVVADDVDVVVDADAGCCSFFADDFGFHWYYCGWFDYDVDVPVMYGDDDS